MEIKIISGKLLLFSIIIAGVIISIKSLSLIAKRPLEITTCNERDHLTIHLRYQGKDFIINPSSLKNVTYCISKSMPFYDRSIEYLINSSSIFNKDIKNRYKVLNVVTNNKIKIADYFIELSSKKVTFTKNDERIIIYTRPIISMYDLYSKRPSKVLSVIRPSSSEKVERLLMKSDFDYEVVLNGEYSKNDF